VSRTEAQRRADDIRVFQGELERVEREGVLTLTDTQRRAVAEHHAALLAEYGKAYDVDQDARAKQLSLGMRIASFAGALALSASVYFLFYQFWGRIATSGQVAILVIAAAATFGATMWIHSRDATGYFTNLAAMVALACFVLDVMMLGQIFNITPSDKALVVWAAMAFLLAYTCDLRLLLAAGMLFALGYAASRVTAWNGENWVHFGGRPENFLVPAMLLFAVPLFIRHDRRDGFPPIYRLVGLLTFFIPLFILSNWGQGSYFALDVGTIEALYQVAGFVTSAAAVWLGIRKQWPETVNVGVTAFVVFLYAKFFDWWWDAMPKSLFFLLLGLAAILILLVLRRVRGMGVVILGGSDA
jgi:uncharacterized membrane protein